MVSGLAFVARALLAAIFLISGVRKIMGFSFVSGMMASKGFPFPDVVLVLTIALELVGGVLLILNWQARYAALALAAFTIVAGVIFHAFWLAPPQQWVNEFNHFLKNVSIVGGLLLVAAWPQQESREQNA